MHATGKERILCRMLTYHSATGSTHCDMVWRVCSIRHCCRVVMSQGDVRVRARLTPCPSLLHHSVSEATMSTLDLHMECKDGSHKQASANGHAAHACYHDDLASSLAAADRCFLLRTPSLQQRLFALHAGIRGVPREAGDQQDVLGHQVTLDHQAALDQRITHDEPALRPPLRRPLSAQRPALRGAARGRPSSIPAWRGQAADRSLGAGGDRGSSATVGMAPRPSRTPPGAPLS